MLREHRMGDASHLNLYLAVIDACHERNMLLMTCIDCAGNQLLHLLSATYYRNF